MHVPFGALYWEASGSMHGSGLIKNLEKDKFIKLHTQFVLGMTQIHANTAILNFFLYFSNIRHASVPFFFKHGYNMTVAFYFQFLIIIRYHSCFKDPAVASGTSYELKIILFIFVFHFHLSLSSLTNCVSCMMQYHQLLNILILFMQRQEMKYLKKEFQTAENRKVICRRFTRSKLIMSFR